MEKTVSKSLKSRLSFLRPHLLRPIALSVFIFTSTLFFSTVVFLGGVDEPRPGITIEAGISALPLASGAGVGSLVVSKVFQLAQLRLRAISGLIYYASFFAVSLFVLFVRQNIPVPGPKPLLWSLPSNQLTFAIFVSIFIFAFHQTIGNATDRLERENKRATEALEKLERQHLLLIEGQEQVRKELAGFLHDSVQSNLVVLGMQMRRAIDELPEQSQAMARSFLEEIERVRSVDVRTAIKQLSPDLDGLSVEPALRELAGKYRKALSVTFDLDGRVVDPGLDLKLKLGIYRIVEQGILNAALHGKASKVSVNIAFDDYGVQLLLINDGVKLAEPFEMGVGLTVIDGWCKTLNGSWKLSSSGEHTMLRVTLNSN